MNTLAHTENATLSAPRGMGFDLSPQSFDQAMTFASMLAESDLVPKDFKGKPGNCLIAMQWGSELGLKPLQAIQNIAPINGRPTLWGDAMLALVRSSPLCESVVEGWHADGTAFCRVKRRGEQEQERTFSDEDAKLAGLLGKAGPWTTNRKRMKQLRARAFALRDVFTDVLRGMAMAEEVMDTPVERHMGPADIVKTAPVPYPADQFEANLQKWREVIEGNRKTADDLIVFAQSRNTPFTEEQKAALNAIKPVKNAGATDSQPKNDPAPTAPAEHQTTGPAITFDQVNTALADAADIDALYTAADLIGEVPDPQQRAELTRVFETRQIALEQN